MGANLRLVSDWQLGAVTTQEPAPGLARRSNQEPNTQQGLPRPSGTTHDVRRTGPVPRAVPERAWRRRTQPVAVPRRTQPVEVPRKDETLEYDGSQQPLPPREPVRAPRMSSQTGSGLLNIEPAPAPRQAAARVQSQSSLLLARDFDLAHPDLDLGRARHEQPLQQQSAMVELSELHARSWQGWAAFAVGAGFAAALLAWFFG